MRVVSDGLHGLILFMNLGRFNTHVKAETSSQFLPVVMGKSINSYGIPVMPPVFSASDTFWLVLLGYTVFNWSFSGEGHERLSNTGELCNILTAWFYDAFLSGAGADGDDDRVESWSWACAAKILMVHNMEDAAELI